MIPPMPESKSRKPPYLAKEVTRHGRVMWYVRKGGIRVRLRAGYGSAAFWEEYMAALAAAARPEGSVRESAHGTLAWLISRYRESEDWLILSAATRRQRENIFAHVLTAAGNKPIGTVDRTNIILGKERRAKTPAQARNFLDAMRGLFKWAVNASLVHVDPTEGVNNPKRKKGDGFVAWTEAHVARYQRHWPRGTRQRVWLDVLLYTGGVRRGDAVRLGRQHVRDGIAEIKTEKSGFTVAVTLPILPVLAETILAGQCGELTFICGERGQPLTKESFGNEFRQACKAAGVPGSAHGVRKLAATTAANNGATVAQLEAMFGWQGGAMASLYTRSADRRRLAVEGMHMMSNTERAHDAGAQVVCRLANDLATTPALPSVRIALPRKKDQ
jgi:integrase